MDTLTYFAIILSIGIICVIVAIAVLLRGWAQARGGPRRSPSQSAPLSPARAQVIYPGQGRPLVWVVGGHSYPNPGAIADPRQRAAFDEFLGLLREALPATPLPTPSPAAAPAPSAPDYAARFSTLDGAQEPLAASAPDGSPVVKPEAVPTASAPLPIPATARTTPPVRRTFEEELELPLFERLKSSFFSGGSNVSSMTQTLERLERASQPVMPRIEELDDLLQMRLVNVPAAPKASIRTGANGLLEIFVAGRAYERIDDVPFDSVRDAMREAVQIWERRIA
jgi:hypothetical protein